MGEMMADDTEEDSGITLPTIGGAIVKAANTGPGKALLNPAAKAFGDYLGWRAKEITERWKKRREANLETHADKVRKKDGPAVPREPTEKQVILINDWVERAQEIDPTEDPEVSALWQALLGAIYKKQNDAKEWLDVLKQINERDAKLILSLRDNPYTPRTSLDRIQADKLLGLGILEKAEWRRYAFFIGITGLATLVTMAMFFAFTSLPQFNMAATPGDAQRLDELRGALWVGGVAFVSGLAVVAIMTFIRAGQYLPTPLGEALRRSALRYLDGPSPPPPPSGNPLHPPPRRRRTRAKPEEKSAEPSDLQSA